LENGKRRDLSKAEKVMRKLINGSEDTIRQQFQADLKQAFEWRQLKSLYDGDIWDEIDQAPSTTLDKIQLFFERQLEIATSDNFDELRRMIQSSQNLKPKASERSVLESEIEDAQKRILLQNLKKFEKAKEIATNMFKEQELDHLTYAELLLVQWVSIEDKVILNDSYESKQTIVAKIQNFFRRRLHELRKLEPEATKKLQELLQEIVRLQDFNIVDLQSSTLKDELEEYSKTNPEGEEFFIEYAGKMKASSLSSNGSPSSKASPSSKGSTEY